MTATTTTAAEAHRHAIETIWDAADSGSRVVVAEAPPGAGKSTATRLLATRAARRSQTAILTQTNAQADDMIEGLLADQADSSLRIGRLHSDSHEAELKATFADQLAAGTLTASKHIHDLADCDIVVAPAQKWAHVGGSWRLGLIDEAFQMRSDLLMAVADRFKAFIALGDAGQLAPWSDSDTKALRGADIDPLATAGATLRLSHPHSPLIRLPVTWRLHPNAAHIVSNSFYSTAFTSGAGPRQLTVPTAGDSPVDAVIAEAAHSGWGLYELPEQTIARTDPQALDALGRIVARLAAGDISYSDEHHHSQTLTPHHIAVGVTHRDQRTRAQSAVDQHLRRIGQPAGSVVVDTANRLQGRQYQVTVAWHPLSGRRDASAFHLEAGRLCVLMSRHRQACIVVSRAGARQLLEAYPGTDPVWLGETLAGVDGWTANIAALEALETHRIPAS